MQIVKSDEIVRNPVVKKCAKLLHIFSSGLSFYNPLYLPIPSPHTYLFQVIYDVQGGGAD